jgi:hypothetical protein
MSDGSPGEVQGETKPEAAKKGPSPVKIVAIIIGVIILLAILGVAYIYLGVIKPLQGLEVKQAGDMRPVSLSPIALEGVIDVYNPGGQTRVPRMDFDLYMDGTLIGSGVVTETIIPAGSTTPMEVTFTSSMSLPDLVLLFQGREQVGVKIGGKIHARPIPIPIPPLPVPIDTSQFLASLNQVSESPMIPVLSILEENPDMTVAEALESPEVMGEIEQRIGREVTDQEIQQARAYLEKQGLADMRAEEILNNPELLAAYQEGMGQP